MTSLILAWFAAFLLWHDASSADRALTAALRFLLPVAFLAVANARFWWLRARPRPVAFDVRDGAFIAPTDDRLLSAHAVMTFAGCAMAGSIFVWPISDDVPRFSIVAGRIVVACIPVLLLLTLTTFVRGAGRIELRPEGLRMTYAYGRCDVPWDAVAAGPPRRETLWEPAMRIGRPDLVRSTGLVRRRPRRAFLPVSWSLVRREFLADAVNHYLATPAARPAIGTADGYAHLRRVLRAG